MKKPNNCILLKMIVIILFMVLASCGRSSAKSDADILKDIQQEDTYFSNYNLIIDSATITKRQTNPEAKTDYVWMDITAKNDQFTYWSKYELEYVLYNEGWLLENCNIAQQEYEVRSYESISQADASRVVAENDYNIYTFLYKDNSYNQVDFYYEASTVEMFLRTDYVIQVSYKFQPNSGWGAPKVYVQQSNNSPDLVGTWKSCDYDMDLTINVLSLDKTSDGDYDLTFTCEFINASIDESGKYATRRIEARHTYIQDTPITINMHRNTIIKNLQTWYGDDFTLVATDGTSHEFMFLIFIGDEGEIYSWNAHEYAEGSGIGWCDWYPIIFEKVVS